MTEQQVTDVMLTKVASESNDWISRIAEYLTGIDGFVPVQKNPQITNPRLRPFSDQQILQPSLDFL